MIIMVAVWSMGIDGVLGGLVSVCDVEALPLPSAGEHESVDVQGEAATH